MPENASYSPLHIKGRAVPLSIQLKGGPITSLESVFMALPDKLRVLVVRIMFALFYHHVIV
jgi:hypothetical protein